MLGVRIRRKLLCEAAIDVHTLEVIEFDAIRCGHVAHKNSFSIRIRVFMLELPFGSGRFHVDAFAGSTGPEYILNATKYRGPT